MKRSGTVARGETGRGDRWGDQGALAVAQGAFNMASGLWPVVHLRSFEAMFGPKADEWLVYTVGGLLAAIGWSQVRAGAAGAAHARRVGMATAATLAAIDVLYVARGRLRWTYLLDVPVEVGWLAAWRRADRSAGARPDAAPGGRRRRPRQAARRW